MQTPISVPWARIFAESVVIIASILLALATDAWWDSRQARVREQEILLGLEADFVANVEQLAIRIQMQETEIAVLGRLERMSADDLAALSADSLSLFLVTAYFPAPTFDAQDGTLDATLASGQLDVLHDLRLRERLVAWKAAVADLYEESNELRAGSELVLRRVSSLGGPWAAASEPLREVMPAEWREQLYQFPQPEPRSLADAELRALLRAKRFRGFIYRGLLTALAERADSTLSSVQAGLR